MRTPIDHENDGDNNIDDNDDIVMKQWNKWNEFALIQVGTIIMH